MKGSQSTEYRYVQVSLHLVQFVILNSFYEHVCAVIILRQQETDQDQSINKLNLDINHIFYEI